MSSIRHSFATKRLTKSSPCFLCNTVIYFDAETCSVCNVTAHKRCTLITPKIPSCKNPMSQPPSPLPAPSHAASETKVTKKKHRKLDFVGSDPSNEQQSRVRGATMYEVPSSSTASRGVTMYNTSPSISSSRPQGSVTPPHPASPSLLNEEGPPLRLEVLSSLIEFLNTEDNMKVNGIFRITGSRSIVSSLHMSLTRPVDLGGYSPVAVASVLKKYLRLSPVPIIPFGCYEAIVMIQQIAQPSDRLREMYLFFTESQELPHESKQCLDVLIPYLQRLSTFSSVNQMDISNLSRMFAPSLIRTPPDTPFTDVNAANAEIGAAKDLLMHFGYLMGYTTEINFDSLNMAWKRKTKRKTMALLAKAEVPDKFLLIDNSRELKVSREERNHKMESAHEVVTNFSGPGKRTSQSLKDTERDRTPIFGEKCEVESEGSVPRDKKGRRSSVEESSDLSAEKAEETPAIPVPQKFAEVKAVESSWNPFQQQTLEITFGEMHVTRKHNDVRIFHYFLVHNYPHIRFPDVPSKEMSKKDPSGSREGFEKFLGFVVSQDELFMDAIFTQRWLEFLGQTKSKKEKEKEREKEREKEKEVSVISGASWLVSIRKTGSGVKSKPEEEDRLVVSPRVERKNA